MYLHFSYDERERMYSIKDFIEKNYRHHYTNVELSRRIGVNVNKLKYGFKQIFNTSPYDYLTHIRTEKAKDLLAATELSINQIAYSVGYRNSSGFIKMFKKNTGTSPLAWRKANKRSYFT